jgi:hypothetical protein
MARVDALYNLLARDVSPDSVEILAEGLSLAQAEYVERIAAILVERRHESAWAALAGNYARLSPGIREKVARKSELLVPGLAAALRHPAAENRRNALELLCETPHPEYAYRAAECVHDASPAVRAAAMRALVRVAEYGLERGPEVRRQVALALRDALRTFERHHAHEVLLAALWYAPELDAELWNVLASTGGSAAQVVERNLKEWADPRLAAFLILALTQTNWQRAALAVLEQWQSRECGLAIVRRLDLLARADVRSVLHKLRNPLWFIAVVGSLSDIPPAVIAALPAWVRHLGFQDHEKWRCLDAWTKSRRPELQLGAVHALALVNDDRALQSLGAVAGKDGAAGAFARWVLVGRRIWSEHAALRRRGAAAVRSG